MEFVNKVINGEMRRAQVVTGDMALSSSTLTTAQRLPTYLVNASGFEPSIVTMGADGLNPGARNAITVQAMLMGYNGATADMWRSNTEGTLLPSLSRTVSANSPIQTNYNARAVWIFLDVTANPGGAETLSLKFRVRDPVSGNTVAHSTQFVTPAAANGTYALHVLPGGTGSGTLMQIANAAVPRQWDALVVPSGVGSWTYSVGFALSGV